MHLLITHKGRKKGLWRKPFHSIARETTFVIYRTIAEKRGKRWNGKLEQTEKTEKKKKKKEMGVLFSTDLLTAGGLRFCCTPRHSTNCQVLKKQNRNSYTNTHAYAFSPQQMFSSGFSHSWTTQRKMAKWSQDSCSVNKWIEYIKDDWGRSAFSFHLIKPHDILLKHSNKQKPSQHPLKWSQISPRSQQPFLIHSTSA